MGRSISLPENSFRYVEYLFFGSWVLVGLSLASMSVGEDSGGIAWGAGIVALGLVGFKAARNWDRSEAGGAVADSDTSSNAGSYEGALADVDNATEELANQTEVDVSSLEE